MVLLLFLAFGLAGMNLLMIQAAFVELADDDAADAREEQALEDTSPGRIRARDKVLARILCSPANLTLAANPENALFTSLSPPHRDTGNVHGVLKVFRI